ncbi:hypothetical protein GCM10022223_33180 [Kineosporia mesophila]|uniref:Transposase IS701-like DDE domain-containing protein n=1 Tax=Kineosporia mesophila TaxID=566012 RepID=A0ABP6ZNI6_9ACTN
MVGDDLCVARVEEWAGGLDGLGDLIGARFARSEPRACAVEYVRGLLSSTERKNSWTLSEQAGHARPDGMQRLLSTAGWDPDLVRDDVRDYVMANIGDPGGVLVLDETGFLKKGTRSAGVSRQYSGTAGRIENCQIGVFLAYAGPAGRTFLDRELYVPAGWFEDRDRCAGAGIGQDVEFATKPELAIVMLERAHAAGIRAGVSAGWVTADEVYGQHYRLRVRCEELGYSYVLAVAVKQRVIIGNDPGSAFGFAARSTRIRCTGCWPAAVSRTPQTWPTTCAMPPSPPHGRNWPGSPGFAGPSRRPSRRRKARRDWIITRSASTAAGTGTSPCPCSLTPS